MARSCLWQSDRNRMSDDPDTHPEEKNRADILWCDPANCQLQVYAYGIRNAGGGIEVNPETGELWCSVNERDALGDNLVPDYITHVQEGGFYGWPWWYMGAHQDPRHAGKASGVEGQGHRAGCLVATAQCIAGVHVLPGDRNSRRNTREIFSRRSMDRGTRRLRVGYEVIRVPLHQTGHASGEYQDFLTGFVLPNGQVWGRPVGMTEATDGSLLVSDDGSNTIWRVSYTGK